MDTSEGKGGKATACRPWGRGGHGCPETKAMGTGEVQGQAKELCRGIRMLFHAPGKALGRAGHF